jgi:acyl transferase domain-containing protein
VEFESLRNVLARGRTSSNPLHISSIKGNIGHAEAASGAAGLAKLLMMLSKEQIPTQVGHEILNPKILPLDRDHIVIPKQLTNWPRVRNLPRRALLNNFGAAGSNASLLLEEYIPPVKVSEAKFDQRSSYVFALSAKTTQAFQQLRLSFCTDSSLRQKLVQDLAYTSTARRIISQARAVMVVKSTEHLFECLESLQPPPQSVKPAVKSVVFTFSGQGGHYLGMGRELFDTVPSFRSDVLECDAILLDAGHKSILPIIQAPPASELHLGKEYGIQAWQCAVFVIEYALARLWMSWNIHPNVLLGHRYVEPVG